MNLKMLEKLKLLASEAGLTWQEARELSFIEFVFIRENYRQARKARSEKQ